MSNLTLDLKTAFRALIRRPAFSILAIVTLAVGLGPTTAIFSMVNGVLLRPYPYQDPERIVRLWAMNRPQGLFGRDLSFPDFVDLRAQNEVFEAMGIARQTRFKVLLGDEPQSVDGAWVTSDLLPLVGARAVEGRLISEEDDTWGAAPVAVLGHDFWQRQFEGDPGVVGRVLTIDGAAHTVVGVLAPEAQFPDEADIFTPLALDPNQSRRDDRRYLTLAKLKPGVGPWQAAAQLGEVAERLAQTHPDTNEDWGVWVNTLRESRVGRYRPILATLGGVVAFVLLLACANVANLMLQRAASAEREMALRLALGSGRWVLVRRFLLEILVLAAVGGAVSLLFAYWVLEAVVRMLPFALPSYMSFDFDPTVLGLLLAVVVLVAVLAGLVPALRASKPSLVAGLGESGGRATSGAGQRRLRALLVGLQLALSVMLLVGAGLMIRSFGKLQDVDPGFGAENTVSLILEMPEEAEADERRALYGRTVERLAAVPGVAAVGSGSFVPMRGALDTSVAVSGAGLGEGEAGVSAGVQLVDGDYFEALDIRVLAGRAFDRQELESGAKVAMISAKTRRLLWPEGEAVGDRLRLTLDEDPDAEWRVIGVVEDVRGRGLAEEPGLGVYLPYAAVAQGGQVLFVRGDTEVTGLAGELRSAVRQVDPRLLVVLVQPLTEVLYWSIWQERMVRYLLTLFAVIALVLAAVGVYGSLSYSVETRQREIGVRMAMGADLATVVKMILRESGRLVAVAMALGLVGAVALGRLIANLLYGVDPFDPPTFVAVVAVLVLVAAAAVLVPALRAGRVDPMSALREE